LNLPNEHRKTENTGFFCFVFLFCCQKSVVKEPYHNFLPGAWFCLFGLRVLGGYPFFPDDYLEKNPLSFKQKIFEDLTVFQSEKL